MGSPNSYIESQYGPGRHPERRTLKEDNQDCPGIRGGTVRAAAFRIGRPCRISSMPWRRSQFLAACALILATLILGTPAAWAVSDEAVPDATVPDETVPDETVPVERPSDSSSLPEACVTALESSVEALQTVSIKFHVKHDYRVEGLPRAKRDDMEIYLDAGRFYLKRARTLPSPTDGSDRVREEEMAFDGSVFYIGNNGRQGQPLVLKMLGDNSEDPQTKYVYIDCDYLDAAGFKLPSTVREWKNSQLQSTVLELVSTGTIVDQSTVGAILSLKLRIPEPAIVNAKRLNLDVLADEMLQGGSTHAQVEQSIEAYRRVRALGWDRQVELELDMEKGFALRRRVDTNPEGKRIQTIECNDFEYTEQAALWLPRKCTVKTYVKSPELLNVFTDDANRTDSIELAEIGFQKREDVAFELDYGAGTLVSDRSSTAAKESPAGEVAYTAPAEGDALREAANKARLGRWRGYFIVINVVVFVALVGRHLYKKRAATRPKP